MMLEKIINFLPMLMLQIGMIISVIAVVFCKRMILIVIFSGIFSLQVALTYLFLAAPDVALTEAAVNASISTVLYLLIISYCKQSQVKPVIINWYVVGLFIILTAIMVYIITFVPIFGEITNPVNTHVYNYYLENASSEIGVQSLVAAILASYRGYDTFGETIVVFTGAICVWNLLRQEVANDK
jgi:multicomponent Na+:H+ antiporter subunit B